jgi:diguanylate cyclase (GGDEF)-like protein/PAS domain S-box-containing protein
MFQRLRSLAQPTSYLGVAVIAAIWGGVFFLANEEHARAYEAASEQGQTLARVFDEYISRVINGVDGELLLLRKIYEQNPSHFDFANLIDNKTILSSLAVHFSITDSRGLIRLSSLGPVRSTVDISNTETFRAQLNSKSDDLYISAPNIGHLSGKLSIQLTRRLIEPDGSFGGTIGASLDVVQLDNFYNSIDIGPAGIITLVGFDGIIRARSGRNPVSSGFIGQSTSQTKLFELIRKSPVGSYWNSTSAHQFEGINRLISYHVVEGLPLIAVVGLAEGDIFRQSQLTARRYYSTAVGVTAIVLIVIILGAMRQWQLEQTSRRVVDQTNKLDMALNNMSQGLLAFDPSKRIIICNQRYIEMYGLSPDVVKPGCTLYELICHRKESGSFTGDVKQYCADVAAAIAQRTITRFVVKTSDGRWIRIVNQPIATGGWIATHEDISEQHHAEQKLDETKRFLDSIIENIPIAVVVKDAKTRKFLLVNRAFETMIGLPQNDLFDKTVFDIYRNKAAEFVDNGDSETLHSSNGFHYSEYEVETPTSGTRIHATNRIVIRDAQGDAKYLIAVIEDVTERKKSEQRIAFMAHHDALTALANRAALAQKIEDAAARHRRWGDPFSVLVLDLDRFKYVNDTLGHAAGDALLREVAARLKAFLRETDVLARLGGDEFAIIQAGGADQREAASTLADRVTDIVAKPFNINGTEIHIGTSIGISLAPDHATDPDSLLKMADMALYSAKSAGRNAYRFFSPEMSVAASERHGLESDLRRAITQDEFELHYQPIIDTKTRKICGAEALIRWRHPAKGMISPDQFIPLAEETGLITQIGEWVLLTACTEAATWPAGVKVAVNLSPVQFRKSNLPEVVMYALAQSGLSPERLELEITETALIESAADCLPILRQFKNLGIAIALDDFGTGYSSLSQLTMFPFDKIKIDKSFTQNLTRRAECAAIISATLTLAQSLDIATTAEGVETVEQYRLLSLAGVTSMQGYLFKDASPATEINLDGIYGAPGLEDAA